MVSLDDGLETRLGNHVRDCVLPAGSYHVLHRDHVETIDCETAAYVHHLCTHSNLSEMISVFPEALRVCEDVYRELFLQWAKL